MVQSLFFPYQSWHVSSQIILERNPNYCPWQPGEGSGATAERAAAAPRGRDLCGTEQHSRGGSSHGEG